MATAPSVLLGVEMCEMRARLDGRTDRGLAAGLPCPRHARRAQAERAKAQERVNAHRADAGVEGARHELRALGEFWVSHTCGARALARAQRVSVMLGLKCAPKSATRTRRPRAAPVKAGEGV